LTPQLEQNLLAGGFVLPHLRHVHVAGVGFVAPIGWIGAFRAERRGSSCLELGKRERVIIQVKKPNGAIAKPMIPTSSTRMFKGG
jgi:hypothetical protein